MWTENNKVGTFESESSLQEALNTVTFPAAWTIQAKGAFFVLIALDGVFIP